MENIKHLIKIVEKIEHGFKPILEQAASIKDTCSPKDCLSIAKKLFASEIHQARALGVFILGFMATQSKEALLFLRQKVSKDTDWRVQEILAKAFDQYCSDTGYEKALPAIKDWLGDHNPNVRRAVTEGLRIWTGREYFKQHPEQTVKLLSPLKGDASEYVRKSVGNALRDISKKHKDLIAAQLKTWDVTNKKVLQTYKLASKFL